jgi:hypothetical protein
VPESLTHLLDAHSFRIAFLVAMSATVVLAIAGLIVNHFRRTPLALAGIAGAAAAIAGLYTSGYWTDDLALGLGVLAVGGIGITLLRPMVDLPLLIGIVFAVPGALIIGSAAKGTTFDWAHAFVVVAIVIAAPLVADFDHYHARAGLAPVFFAVTALGVYWCVPDTEEAVALVGATLPLILLGFPRPLVAMGRAGSYALVGTVVWVAVVDGRGRATSVVGATLCLGVMLLDPLLDRALPSREERVVGPWSWPPLLVTAIHVGLVAVASRVVGVQGTLLAAGITGAAAFAVAATLLALVPQYFVRRSAIAR